MSFQIVLRLYILANQCVIDKEAKSYRQRNHAERGAIIAAGSMRPIRENVTM
jgi:hypothetical protein